MLWHIRLRRPYGFDLQCDLRESRSALQPPIARVISCAGCKGRLLSLSVGATTRSSWPVRGLANLERSLEWNPNCTPVQKPRKSGCRSRPAGVWLFGRIAARPSWGKNGLGRSLAGAYPATTRNLPGSALGSNGTLPCSKIQASIFSWCTRSKSSGLTV